MFDLNLLAKPGLQGEKNNDTVSYIEDYSRTLNKTDKQYQSKKKARNKFLVIIGFLVSIISALVIIYFLPLITKKNIELKKNILQNNISKNDIISDLVDLLLHPRFNKKIKKIHFNNNFLQIKFEELDQISFDQLEKDFFYKTFIRTSVNILDKKEIMYRLPWIGISEFRNEDLKTINEKIGQRFILKSLYDITENKYNFTINEFKSLSSIILRLHNSDIIDNYEIEIISNENNYPLISFKNF
tara:strand:+ start:829 stop:1557 length:729 start_codon:yes stop_codon:yes gene_type:complete